MRLVFALLLAGISVGCADVEERSTPWSFGEDGAPTAAPEPASEDPQTPPTDLDPPPSVSQPTPEPVEEPVEPQPEEPVPLDWFAGHWLVSQPSHALYEETLYHFRDDGALFEIASFSHGHPIPTGRVARCLQFHTESWERCDGAGTECETIETTLCSEWGEECLFGDAWRVVDQATISIVGDCTDGVSREIVLAMESEAFGMKVVSVADETDWLHNSFDWAWQRCEEAVPTDCLMGY